MRGGVVGVLVCALGALGCSPAFQSRLPDVVVTPARMVVLPVLVKELELDASEETTLQSDPSAIVRSNIEAAVGAQTAARGAHAFSPNAMDGRDPAVRLLYARLWRWTETASIEIAAQKDGHRDFGRHSVGDWRFRGDLGPLADALQADTALTVLVRDTHQSTARAMMGGGIYWAQIGAACLISLHDGRMLWCDAKIDAWGDLQKPAVADAAIRQLLAGLDASPPAVAAAK
jgi:hypothetical protein